tara:strand:+ start:1496 stop:2950 length:1455 start_codon:yes stop_codon:yes gene_type:complete
MLKEFIELANFEDIPIGPQADLLSLLHDINRYTPDYLNIDDLEVTKKFNWKPGTYNKVERLRSYYLGTHQTRYSSVLEIFDKPDRNRGNYYLNRFKRKLAEIDNHLARKRSAGAIWTDDPNIIDTIKESAINDAIDLFHVYEEYLSMYSNDNKDVVRYYVHKDRNENIVSFLDDVLNEMWKFESEQVSIILDEVSERIYLIQPLKDIPMNVYDGDDTIPVYRYNTGHVLALHQVSLKALMYWAVKVRPRGRFAHDMNVASSFWFKPLIQGVKHPFLQYPGSSYDPDHSIDEKSDPSKWKIYYNRPSSQCYGNFNYLFGRMEDINFVKWSETVFTWLSTFRMGVTHPLNNITMGYYGHPSKHDDVLNSEYLDRIGMNTTDCTNRMSNHIANVEDRQSLCMKYCINEVRQDCSGFQHDIDELKRTRLRGWQRKKHQFMECLNVEDTYPGNFNWSYEGSDDNYPRREITISDEESLERSMLEWVSQQ